MGSAYVVAVGVLAGTSAATEKPAWYIATVAATLPLGIGFPIALFFVLGVLAAAFGLNVDGNSSWPAACLQVGLSAGLWMGLAWVNAKAVGDFAATAPGGDCCVVLLGSERRPGGCSDWWGSAGLNADPRYDRSHPAC